MLRESDRRLPQHWHALRERKAFPERAVALGITSASLDTRVPSLSTNKDTHQDENTNQEWLMAQMSRYRELQVR
jgi:hypothetical protein